MKIQKTELANLLNVIKGVVPKKTSHPALQGVLVSDGRFTASNLEMAVTCRAGGAEEERFLIPQQAFGLINSLPDGEVELSASGKDILEIKAGKVKNRCRTQDPDLFPEIEPLEGKSEASVNAEMFLKSLKHVSYAAPMHEWNAACTSVCLQAGEGYLNVTGANGRVMAWDKTDYDGEFELLLPKGTVDRLKSLGLAGDVQIRHNRKGALFCTEDFQVYTRLIEGRYYKYHKMFQELPMRGVVSRMGLVAAMERVEKCMEKKRPVVFRLSGNTLSMDMKGEFMDYHETVELQGNIPGELTMGFDPTLVLETMKAFECEAIKISFGGPRMPMMVEDGGSSFKAIILPVEIGSCRMP